MLQILLAIAPSPQRLMMPAMALIGLLVTAAAILAISGRQKQIAKRVDTLAATSGPGTLDADANIHSIRRRDSGVGSRGRRLRSLFRMPEDLPLAHLVPPWLVFALGAVIAIIGILLIRTVADTIVAAIISLLLGLLVIRTVFNFERERYTTKLLHQLPDTIELIVSATRAGLPISEAMRSVAREQVSPTKEEFSRAANEITLGATPDGALVAMYQRTDLTEYSILAVTLAVQSRSGGRLAESLQNLAETARQRVALAGKAAALSAEGKLSAGILSIMPVFAATGLSMMQAHYVEDFTGTTGGRHMIVFAVCTLVMGILTMRWLIRRATAP
jgi:tight adherence protein B